MVFPHPDGPFGGDARGGEPLIVPLAIPALAGPSALATVMLLTSQAPGKMFEWIGALTVTMIVCAIVLMLAERIQEWLGERTMTAFERLMGLVLVAISVEMMLGGIRSVRASTVRPSPASVQRERCALSRCARTHQQKSGPRGPLLLRRSHRSRVSAATQTRIQAPSVNARMVGRLRQ